MKGAKVTARLVKERLERELIGNVSLRVLPTDRPDTWEVQGRGELALAILVEQMRREGYELTVGKPQVPRRSTDGCMSRWSASPSTCPHGVPRERSPSCSAARKGRMEQLVNHGTGWVAGVADPGPWPDRVPYRVPHRDPRNRHRPPRLRGVRAVVRPELRTRATGSLVADRAGVATAFAMFNLQERGSLFVEPGTEVYQGMIVRESSAPTTWTSTSRRRRSSPTFAPPPARSWSG